MLCQETITSFSTLLFLDARSSLRARHTKIVEMLIDVSETLKLDLASKNKTVENAYTGFQLADIYGETNVVELIKSKMPSLVVYQNPKRKRCYGKVST